MPTPEIREVITSHPGALAKINAKHNLSLDDVDQALGGPIATRWDDDPERGRRLLVRARVRGRAVDIVLKQLDVEQGIWELRTAFYA